AAIPVVFGLASGSKPLPDAEYLFTSDSGLDVYTAQVKDSDLAWLKANPGVAYLERDAELSAARIVPSDTYFTENDLEEDAQWHLERMKLAQDWEYGRGSKNVTVAVIDTGIHASHLELNDGRVAAGFDVLKNEPIAANSNSDENGHGTAVAGVIGAIPNNDRGIAGINWKISLMPVKALSAEGRGAVSSVSKAIVWAADNGANVINLSLG